MPYKQVYVKPERVLKYKGVVVYFTYKDDDVEDPSGCWFSLDPDDTDYEGRAAFDVRDLPQYAEVMARMEPEGSLRVDPTLEEARAILKAAIGAGDLRPGIEDGELFLTDHEGILLLARPRYALEPPGGGPPLVLSPEELLGFDDTSEEDTISCHVEYHAYDPDREEHPDEKMGQAPDFVNRVAAKVAKLPGIKRALPEVCPERGVVVLTVAADSIPDLLNATRRVLSEGDAWSSGSKALDRVPWSGPEGRYRLE
jgi:hypothetical protein